MFGPMAKGTAFWRKCRLLFRGIERRRERLRGWLWGVYKLPIIDSDCRSGFGRSVIYDVSVPIRVGPALCDSSKRIVVHCG